MRLKPVVSYRWSVMYVIAEKRGYNQRRNNYRALAATPAKKQRSFFAIQSQS